MLTIRYSPLAIRQRSGDALVAGYLPTCLEIVSSFVPSYFLFRMSRIIFAFCICLVVAAPALAGDYRYRSQAKIVVAPQFFYFVGAPVRIEALLEAERRRDPEYQRFLRSEMYGGAYQGPLSSAKPQAEDRPATANAATVVRRCAACHGGAAPEGGLSLEGGSLTAPQITKAQRRVLRGEMPPGEPLSPEEIGQVIQELLSLERGGP